MREDSAHTRSYDVSAAAEIFADSTYFPNTLRTKKFDVVNCDNRNDWILLIVVPHAACRICNSSLLLILRRVVLIVLLDSKNHCKSSQTQNALF
jgi:hypothetical protein